MSGPYVLFVDDDHANLVVFEATCAGDFPVLVAGGGEQALELMRNHEIGVLITDQRMPHMTGVQLLERVHQEYPDVVRILITAYSDLNDAIAAINMGHVRRYMRKPWVPEELRAVIKESLEIYTMTGRMRSMEQRLLQTERVYALGVVAAAIAQELHEPTLQLAERLSAAKVALKNALRLAEQPMKQTAALRGALEEAEEELNETQYGVQRVMDVVRGIELPTRDTEGESADIGEVLRLTLKLVRRELQQRGQVQLDVQSVPRVRGSSTKLGQVVLNVVMNAAKSLANANLDSTKGVLTIRLHPHAKFVKFEVTDNGEEFDPKKWDAMFDPFPGARHSVVGARMGLAISKAIAEELGGRIEAERNDGRGSTVRVLFPVA
jgi:two-component system NtrC family sensor kinase